MPRVKLFAVDDVLTKAIGRFSIHGYHATSMSELVDGMGIGRASIYDTFGSKRGLFLRAMRLYIESYDRSIQELLNQSSTPTEAILGLFEEAAANGCFIVNAGIEPASHDAEITRIVTDFYRTTEHRFRALIEQGQHDGEIDDGLDSLQTAHGLFGLLLGLWDFVRSGASGEPALRAVQQVLALVPEHQPGGPEQKAASMLVPEDPLMTSADRSDGCRD